MPLRAVFLDIGQTLLFEQPSRFAIYADVATRAGAPSNEADMRARMSAAHRELPLRIDGAFRYSDPWFRAFIARIFGAEGLGLAPDVVENATEELFDRFESPRNFRLFPGARELTDTLRLAGLRVGVVSNWSARLPRLLAALGLEHAFDFVLSSAIEGLEKPDPLFFRLALERAGVHAAEALHAGDHPRLDVEAAKNAGLQAVLVDHAADAAGENGGFEDGTDRVRSLKALGAFILERNP